MWSQYLREEIGLDDKPYDALKLLDTPPLGPDDFSSEAWMIGVGEGISAPSTVEDRIPCHS